MNVQSVTNRVIPKICNNHVPMLTQPIRNGIPDVLIYSQKNGLNIMIDTKKQASVGRMRTDIRTDCVYVSELFIYPQFRRQGYGSKFLDYVKNLSKKSCESGKVRLFSALIPNEDKPPHIFYRKNEFFSRDKEVLNQIDNCIKNGTDVPKIIDPIVMRYEPK